MEQFVTFPTKPADSETCRAAGMEIAYHELADSLITLLTLIGHGQGISLVPSHSASIAHPSTVFIPLLDSPRPHIVFHAAIREGEVRPEIAQLLEACRVEGANSDQSRPMASFPAGSSASH